ncbi:MAG: PD-(D/E)XK nuclease family protein [Candidatus Thorarchaeota archaeon]
MQGILRKGKLIDKKALLDFYQEVTNIGLGSQPHTIHPEERLFSASSTICTKETLLKAVAPHCKKPTEMSTQRKFDIGHWWHDIADKGADKALWSMRGECVRLSPFEVLAFPELFEVHDNIDGVPGTPDHLLYFPTDRFLLLVDQKSAQTYSFNKINKEGTQVYHGIQVGTYLDGLMKSPIGPMVDSVGVHMCHMHKSDGAIRMTHVDSLMLQMAKVYWKDISNALERFNATGNFPGEVEPTVKWACSYCSFFKDWDQCAGCTTVEQLEEITNE